jgi:hypothetical protein
VIILVRVITAKEDNEVSETEQDKIASSSHTRRTIYVSKFGRKVRRPEKL